MKILHDFIETKQDIQYAIVAHETRRIKLQIKQNCNLPRRHRDIHDIYLGYPQVYPDFDPIDNPEMRICPHQGYQLKNLKGQLFLS